VVGLIDLFEEHFMFKMTFILFLFILIKSHAVINGVLVKAGGYPEVVGISKIKSKWDSSVESNCSGVLVAPTLVITSAHCVTERKFNVPGTRVTNVNDVKKAKWNKETYLALRGKAYPEYDRMMKAGEIGFKKTHNDIGYIVLDKPVVDFKSDFHFISDQDLGQLILNTNLNLESDRNQVQLKIVSYGPGKKVKDELNFFEFGLKREASVPMSKMSYFAIEHNLIGSAISVAPGDSGSPIFYHDGLKNILISIASLSLNEKTKNTFYSTILSYEKLCWVQKSSQVKIGNLVCNQ
jgi:V8-like Glu-specific endopeptidase